MPLAYFGNTISLVSNIVERIIIFSRHEYKRSNESSSWDMVWARSSWSYLSTSLVLKSRKYTFGDRCKCIRWALNQMIINQFFNSKYRAWSMVEFSILGLQNWLKKLWRWQIALDSFKLTELSLSAWNFWFSLKSRKWFDGQTFTLALCCWCKMLIADFYHSGTSML